MCTGKNNVKRSKSFIHRWGCLILAMMFTFVSHLINEYVVAINILLSNNVEDILKATITFTSIISGFSSSLIGQLINAKNSKNEFLLWYFKKCDSTTFIVNVMAGTVTAFILIGFSIFLLSYDTFNENLKMMATYVWTLSMFSFIVYQINNYYLYLKLLLFIPIKKNEHNEVKNLDDNQKKALFSSLSKNTPNCIEEPISIDVLKRKNNF